MPTSVDDFWRLFDNEPVIFFVGSAISLFHPSNLPSATELVDAVIEALVAGSPLTSLRPQLDAVQWPRLESVLQEIDYCDPAAAVGTLAVLKEGTPNLYHKFLAARLGRRIPRIYTTNQDEMIEAALDDVGCRSGRDYQAWQPGDVWSAQSLVKLHGTLGRPPSIRTTLRHVSQGLPIGVREQLLADLSGTTVCVLGYSGNDVDLRPVFRGAKIRQLFWLVRESSGLAFELQASGAAVFPIPGDLRSFLRESVLASPTAWRRHAAVAAALDSLDLFVRTNILSRLVGLSASRRKSGPTTASVRLPYEPDLDRLHARCNREARRLGSGHAERWRAWYDAGERFLRYAGIIRNNLAAGYCYWRGWRASRDTDPVGALLCLRGLWMACDLLAYGVLPISYVPGLRWFALRATRLLQRTPSEDRAYWAGLVQLLALRGSFRTGRLNDAKVLAQSLLVTGQLGPHLRGHALRYLGRVEARQGNYADAAGHFEQALEEFDYMQADIEKRDVLRAWSVCELTAGRLSEAMDRRREACADVLEPRERIRCDLLGAALCLSGCRLPFAKIIGSMLSRLV